jgi:hypothetical protein
MVFTYVETPMHFNNIGMVKHYERFPFFEYLGLFLESKDLFLFDNFNGIEVTGKFMLGKEYLAI